MGSKIAKELLIEKKRRQARKELSFSQYKKVMYEDYCNRGSGEKSFNKYCCDNKQIIRSSYEDLVEEVAISKIDKLERRKKLIQKKLNGDKSWIDKIKSFFS